MIINRIMLAAACSALALGPTGETAAKTVKAKAGHHQAAKGSWDGRWVGAWGGSRPTAQIVKDGKLVAYEYEGKTFPVASSFVTATKIVYGDDVVVTMTRTGANTAHATIKTKQGDGTAELTRQ